MARTPALPKRRTQDLHKGRVSLSGARYFLTLALERRVSLLSVCAEEVRGVLDGMVQAGDIELLCGTVMPDHLHLLVTLGNRLEIGQSVGKLKMLTRDVLRRQGLQWQRDFFEHRLRPEELADSYGRYIFMNPYRAGVAERTERWPHWVCADARQFDFVQTWMRTGAHQRSGWC